MARNIEIKTRSTSFEEQARIAARIADGPPVLIEQTDTFFHVPRGRLKLREFGNGTGELIQYIRADSSGPKQSTYVRSPTHEPQSLKEALSAALGVRAIVQKRRTLFMVGQTRIHLDEVKGLGRFIELEVVLRPEQTEEEGDSRRGAANVKAWHPPSRFGRGGICRSAGEWKAQQQRGADALTLTLGRQRRSRMVATGKCPKCESVVSSVRIEDVDGKVGFQSKWHCISYCCPSCNTVLGVQMDPVALKTDTINGVVEKLRGQV
ncbi:class IV adenylate cyclase [Aquisalimonas asiatica]|uniref:Adenylate cyclase class IV, CYTH domain n=1 Tax=Aquisalimonas asiatica TaxID=406100 RepID=A0A1H8UXF8_9GAMM|nr:class IV adenylate cyclase [Aquisalimonas asiatica]SEP07673.1 Adenylate cyclase class IV, CYTH domain [Aquisalimonas asiatica]